MFKEIDSIESWSRPASPDSEPSMRPRRFRFQDEARLRFFSSRDQHREWSAWYPASKADAKLDVFLHDALQAGAPATEPGIDLLACHSDSSGGVLGMTEDQFRSIEKSGIPLSKVSFFEEKGQYGHSVDWDRDQPQVLSIWWHSPEAFIHEISCCIQVDLVRGSTVAVYFDRNEDRIKAVLEHMRSCLDDFLTAPFVLLVKLLAEYAAGSESWRLLIDGRIRLMEGETGARSQKLELEPDKSHGFNFGRLTMSMQNSNTGLVSLEHVVNWQILMNSFTSEMWELYVNLQQSRPGTAHITQQQSSKILHEIQNQAKDGQLRYRRVIGAQKRMQSQISILLSLISQRDNRVNIQLAQESRAIAAAAKQDSKVMRVIAVLTLVFLPATLIATIFSSGIFNLGDLGDGGTRVSPLWWVFALASLLSTAIVMVAGYLFLRLDAKSQPNNGRSMTWNSTSDG